MRHVVMFSGGLASWAAGKRVAAKRVMQEIDGQRVKNNAEITCRAKPNLEVAQSKGHLCYPGGGQRGSGTGIDRESLAETEARQWCATRDAQGNRPGDRETVEEFG